MDKLKSFVYDKRQQVWFSLLYGPLPVLLGVSDLFLVDLRLTMISLGGAVQQHGYCPLWLRSGHDVADQHQQGLSLHDGFGGGVAAGWCDCGVYLLEALSIEHAPETNCCQSVYYLGC